MIATSLKFMSYTRPSCCDWIEQYFAGPILFISVVHMIVVYNKLNKIANLKFDVTILNNIVENCQQCGYHDIVQDCFNQHCTDISTPEK